LSTDFITIKECVAAKKGSFIGVIIKQSDLKSGTTNEKDWTKKTYTITDATGEIELTAWNEEIEMFKVGNKYEFTGLWWKEYEGKITLSVGKYANLKVIGTDEINNTNQTKVDEPTRGEAKGEPLPKIQDEKFEKFIVKENEKLAQISALVTEKLQKQSPLGQPNGQVVGLRTKEIYRSWQKELEN